MSVLPRQVRVSVLFQVDEGSSHTRLEVGCSVSFDEAYKLVVSSLSEIQKEIDNADKCYFNDLNRMRFHGKLAAKRPAIDAHKDSPIQPPSVDSLVDRGQERALQPRKAETPSGAHPVFDVALTDSDPYDERPGPWYDMKRVREIEAETGIPFVAKPLKSETLAGVRHAGAEKLEDSALREWYGASYIDRTLGRVGVGDDFRAGWVAALSASPAARPGDGVETLRSLSDVAAPGEWSVSGIRRPVDEASCVIIDAPSCPGLLALPTGKGAQAIEALRDAKFAVAAVNFVRSQLAAAPAADGKGVS